MRPPVFIVKEYMRTVGPDLTSSFTRMKKEVFEVISFNDMKYFQWLQRECGGIVGHYLGSRNCMKDLFCLSWLQSDMASGCSYYMLFIEKY